MPDHPDAVPAPESLAGLVERVTFQNPETGFCILRVTARGHRDLVSVLGVAPELNPGEWVEASGRWENDPRHGLQFRAAELKLSRPDTLEGIRRYLGSGLIHGIGPHYAEKLVAAFGLEVFDVMENRSARLLEVEGIGPGRRDQIRIAWQEQRRIRDIMAFLFSHGVSTARAFRIYKVYGDSAIDKVRLDPYCLARDISGIGFRTADQIARKLGIAEDSELRARAGVEYLLLERTKEGHCACPRCLLVEQTANGLGIPDAIVATAVDFGLGEKRLVQRETPDGPLVYLAALDAAETEVARRLALLAAGAAPLAGVNADLALAWVEKRIGFSLEAAQRDAVREALRAKMLVITGGPGVGKTTILRALVEIYRAKKMRVLLCAPTGRAAKRLSESARIPALTIHRLLKIKPDGGFVHGPGHPLEADLIVVDESSMVDLPLAQHLFRAIPRAAVLVLVGDADQLPSVGPGTVLQDLIASGKIPVCRLTHVFRQAARSRIVTNAHRINQGEMPHFPPSKDAGPEEDFFFMEAEDPAKAVEAITRLVRQAIPDRFQLHPLDDIQVLTPMQRGELGARNLNAVLQQALNPSAPAIERLGVQYREGDKVMQLENDYDKEVFNGDIGRIRRIREDTRDVEVVFDGRAVAYRAHELDGLGLSYAVTIHKSQGSEYPCVIVPIHTQHYTMLRRNLLYTAVTRGKRLVVLVGTRKALAIAVRTEDARRRQTTLRERVLEAFDRPSRGRG
jgi:exodeoxyribonuclease V alpha subunit